MTWTRVFPFGDAGAQLSINICTQVQRGGGFQLCVLVSQCLDVLVALAPGSRQVTWEQRGVVDSLFASWRPASGSKMLQSLWGDSFTASCLGPLTFCLPACSPCRVVCVPGVRGRCGPVDKLKQIYVIIPSETRENGRVEPSTEKALSDRRIPTRIDIATVLDVLDSPLTPSRIWVKDSAAAVFCAIFSCRLPMPNIKLASRSRSLPKDEAAGSWKLNKRNYKHFALVLSSSSPPCLLATPSICQFISRA